ncbi:hypothetical protein DTO013E5_2627 [Penicillium roqueforti]|uniref:Genomic scaffold, ProqFM164S02 n=1 Tax=Penicillium roqueforti (strain FM164) TaxID=1365484 RepID=W6Q1J4_PENRF|nr:uncharacterized protein LCP9604111_8641 [Penicillium roqueforti]CDM30413.1 unnamed protein product [Penicillium roqueforti FM164]KAF9240787.1 hypothetical protein LCP9604111_8641 [Penicillium roqueforti]KAI2680859.1 hypothetical protein CBS147355_3839 [Penicillium roqueforti]KAI2691668.1 hypothetical protein LCP963914a_1869 [Penicillium roqueforti]KAI2706195.1 hypothetical protein CBS147372_106 [Penicillium roqueforti]
MASPLEFGGSPAHSESFSSPNPPPTTPPVRTKPLPHNDGPVTSGPDHPSSPISFEGDKPISIPTAPLSPLSVDGDSYISVPKNSNRYSRGRNDSQPLYIDTAASRHGSASYLRSVLEDDDDDDDDEDEGSNYFDEEYEHQFMNGTPLHSRLDSEPFIPILRSPPLTKRSSRRATSMALHMSMNRPPPLHFKVDSRAVSMSMGAGDPRNPRTPGNKISSFFGWKGNNTSPGGESSSTEISDSGRSATHFPMPPLANVPFNPGSPYDPKTNGYGHPARTSMGSSSLKENIFISKIADIENELREISSELARSIRREMDLEDLVERLQLEGPDINRRTSDYFSDSGNSSVRYASDAGKSEDIEKIRRAADQERAQLKVELSQKLQEERSQRLASESHVQILESQVQQLRRDRTDTSDLSSKTKELETALENTKRKLLEERQSKDNFEDLLTAMRVELEQLRNDRDQLRDDNRLIEEIEALKIENASLAQLQGGRFASIAEEGASPRNSAFGVRRSSSVARKPSSLAHSGGLSRSNSVNNNSGGKSPETRESLVDKVHDIEVQRDVLHRTLRSLLDRQAYQAREYEKRTRLLEMELARAQQSGQPRKLGYERDVRNLRDEVNHLRMRAEDALDGKWQCEKNLAGLKMDLDRAEQETSSLRALLVEDTAAGAELMTGQEGFAEVATTSSSLQSAFQKLQADQAEAKAGVADSEELASSLIRIETLGSKVHYQLQTNTSLHSRLATAIDKGDKDQQLSVERINILQNHMRELEEVLLVAQNHTEEEMGKHEDELRLLKESQHAQLTRMMNGGRNTLVLSPRPPNAPFDARSPRLDQTTSGEGVPLTQVVQSEILERRVKDLEKLLRDADMEMEQVVGRMNRTQIDVAQLQTDRDDALRQTRQLLAEIQAERDALRGLIDAL